MTLPPRQSKVGLLLRAFGVKPEPAPLQATWECPRCGHKHPVGVYVAGQLVPYDTLLRERYENDEINIETFERLLRGDVA